MPVSDIAAMMTSPDPGATLGAKAIAAVGKFSRLYKLGRLEQIIDFLRILV